MKSLEVFKSSFNGRFWQKLRESVVEYGENEFPNLHERESFLTSLYKEIITNTYLPGVPREYIVSDKHNLVSRIVPTFSVREYCVYFYCISQLEKYIADGESRVPGTFGGWRLNNSLSEAEKKEIDEQEGLYMANADSDAVNAYNPLAWRRHWKKFQSRAYDAAKVYEQHGSFYCIKFDLANFYDCINLNRLKRQVQICCSEEGLSDEIDLLFLFLESWNRRFEGYLPKTIGIPQDEVQDCSRILANFYIRNYDKFMYDICSRSSANYLRYADDQLIITQDETTAKKILYEASKKLNSVGLNINSAKVEIFPSIDEYYSYWSFDIYQLLPDDELNNENNIERALTIYFRRKDNNTRFRDYSVINRLLMCNLDNINLNLKLRFFSEILDDKFLAQCSFLYLKKIQRILEENMKEKYLATLDSISKSINYNSFHYALLKLYREIGRTEKIPEILTIIEELKV